MVADFGAGAEVGNHLAALGARQQREQLAAFVLHLDVAAREDLQLVQPRLARDAQPERRIRRGRSIDTVRLQFGLSRVALGLERVDPQVEPGRRIQRVDQGPELVAELGLQGRREPFGQVVAQFLGQRAAVDLLDLGQPVLLRLVQGRAQKALVALPRKHREAPFHLALARLRKVLKQQPLAQHRIGRFRQRVTLAAAERAVLAKEVGDDAVGRMLQLQHAVQQFGAQFEKRVRVHHRIILGAHD